MKEKKIEIIRNKVDQIDRQIIQLIINRLYNDFKGFIKKDEIRSLFVQIYKISRKRQIESNKSFEKGDS